MRKIWFILWMIVGALFPVCAGSILGGHFYTVPGRVYVNQPFELHCKLFVTLESEVEDIRLSNFVDDPSLIEWEAWKVLSQAREQRASGPVSVVHLMRPGRAKRSFRRVMESEVNCSLVERRGGGFFSQWRAYPKRRALKPFTFDFPALPTAGRPPDYQGAIGKFSLDGSLSKCSVVPGDIITLTLEMRGKGWMEERVMPLPATNAFFKTYPPRQLVREPLHWVTEQVWIPTSTNAVEIGRVSFPYFNPETERYERCGAGPFPIRFVSPHSETQAVQTVKLIHTDTATAEKGLELDFTTLHEQGHHLWPLLIVAVFLLAAFFILFQLAGSHTVAGIIGAALTIAVGAGLGLWMDRRDQIGLQKLERPCEVRLAPAESSILLFRLEEGAEVLPMERAGRWTRVEAEGRRGWIRELESSVCR